MRPVQRWTRRLLAPLRWALALLLLFEEWGWEPLQQALSRLAARLRLQRLERWVGGLPPWGALLLFGLPALALLPVKLLALWAIGQGHALLGVAVIVAAKLVGTAVVARLYTLTQAALLRLPWFAALHAHWTGWKRALLAPVRASWPWRAARVLRRRWARRLHRAQRR